MNYNLNDLRLGKVEPLVNYDSGSVQIKSATDTDLLQTPDKYALPLKIAITAKTDSTNIRLYYGVGEIIFNWECNLNQLRLHDPLTAAQFGYNDLGYIEPNQLTEIVWELELNVMRIIVDGKVRFESSDVPYLQDIKKSKKILSKVGVGSAWGSNITITKFDVENIK